MNIRHLQGWALVTSAVGILLLLVLRFTDLSTMPYLSETLTIMSSLFFIVGLPGIQSVQPQTKYWGKIGLLLMLIPALNQLFRMMTILFVEYPLELNQLVGSIWDSLAAVGVIYLGYIIVGWLTIQARVFPAWVGWLLLIIGISHDVTWFVILYGNADSIPTSILVNSALFLMLMEAVTLIGYGTSIIKYKVPRKKRTQHGVHPTGGSRRVL